MRDRRLHATIANIALLFGSIVLFLAFCELVVFRVLFLPSDVPENEYRNGLIRYTSNKHGIWRVQDEIVAAAHNIRLLLVMDGVRQAIYQGAGNARQYGTGALALNALAADAAKRHGIPFIDLHPRFERDWLQNGKRFDFEQDPHWNERGHAIAVAAIEEFVRRGL